MTSLMLMILELLQNKFSKTTLGGFLFAVFFIMLWVIAGFRSVGFDYLNYKRAFDYLSLDNWFYWSKAMDFEAGYAYLNFIINDFRLLVNFMCFVSVLFSYLFIKKFSYLPFLSIFIFISMYYYIFVMGQSRQMLALSIILLSLLYHPSIFKLILGILLASSIHTSSVICLLLIPMYFVRKVFSTKLYATILIASFAISLVSGNILLIIQPYLPTYINAKLDLYLNYNDYVLGLNIANLIRIIILFLSIGAYSYISKSKFSSIYALFINMYFVGIIIYILLGMVPAFAARGSMYFLFIEILLVPFILKHSKSIFRMPLFIIYILQLIIRQLLFFSEWYEDYIPYNNILF